MRRRAHFTHGPRGTVLVTIDCRDTWLSYKKAEWLFTLTMAWNMVALGKTDIASSSFLHSRCKTSDGRAQYWGMLALSRNETETLLVLNQIARSFERRGYDTKIEREEFYDQARRHNEARRSS